MSFSESFVKIAKQVLPMPFTIAVLLTFFTLGLALLITEPQQESQWHLTELLGYWEGNFFAFLSFGMQMMLILVLGHVLALTKPINALMNALLTFCTSTASSAMLVGASTILMGSINWGLGLIFGAIFARKVAEHCQQNKIPLNYPLIGAAGYAGLMVWHGGLSGTAPLKVAESDHKLIELTGQISTSETLLSTMNICTFSLLMILVPLGLYLLGKRLSPQKIRLPQAVRREKGAKPQGAERLDHSAFLAVLTGSMMVFYTFYKAFILPEALSLNEVLKLDHINFLFFGLGLLFHGSFHRFVEAVGSAMSGAAGIMIQFPLYAGIMGIMRDSGMIVDFSEMFIALSNETTFPLLTFFSAGLVNIFVPSGGGQWLVQGPVVIEAAKELNVPLSKTIMALAYGDQVTNMLQPFWALPLLGITGLKAKEILPYTLFIMLIGISIFVSVLLIF